MTPKGKNPFHAHDIHAKKITHYIRTWQCFYWNKTAKIQLSFSFPLGRGNKLGNTRPRLIVVCEHSIL